MVGDVVLPGLSCEGISVSPISEVQGVPTRRFRKELIRVGSYHQPSSKTDFTITTNTLDRWVDNFRSFQREGVKVPVPEGHTNDPTKNLGYVVDLFRDGNSLFGILEMRGQKAIDSTLANDVSIYSPAKWVDGRGNTYTNPIVHVAITSYPVIPGLSEFEALAASLVKENDMSWKKVLEALGCAEKVDDSTAPDRVLSLVGEMKKKGEEELKSVQLALEAAKSTLAELKSGSKEPQRKADPVVLSLARENREMKLDTLVEKGHISPKVGKGLKEMFVTDAVLSLSLGQEWDVFPKLVQVLSENVSVDLKERTGSQVLNLSNEGEQKTGESGLVKLMKSRSQKK